MFVCLSMVLFPALGQLLPKKTIFYFFTATPRQAPTETGLVLGKWLEDLRLVQGQPGEEILLRA